MFMITMPPTIMKTADDAHRHSRDGRRQAFPQAHDRVRGEEAEVVVLSRPQVAVGAQQHAHFVLGLVQMRLSTRFGDDADAVAAAVRLEVALDGDHHEVVLRVAEDAAQRLRHADHFVGNALHLDGLADRVAPFEEALAQVVADEDHRRVTAHFFVGDGAADVHLDIVDGRDVVGDALHVHAENAVALEGHARLRRRHHAEVLQQGGVAL